MQNAAKIYDLSGHLLVSSINGSGNYALDISSLQRGFLVLRIESEKKNSIESYKLINE